MSFSLDAVVPWGRSFDEYAAMFALTREDLASRILGCGDGPASFNAEATARGHRVVSADPLYRFSADAIRTRVEAVAPIMANEVRRNVHEFAWTHLRSVDELIATRLGAMRAFLDDFPAGRAAGRYVDASLPTLPFAHEAFDLALCSHFLFLYSAQHDAPFHVDAITELRRTSREVRVFPILELGSVPSRHLATVVGGLEARGFRVEHVRVPYEFQRGGNEMLRVV